VAPSMMRLGAFMRPISIHSAAWRYPNGLADANFNSAHLRSFAQTLESGRFDAFFMADHLAVPNMPLKAPQRNATVTSFDPLPLLPALPILEGFDPCSFAGCSCTVARPTATSITKPWEAAADIPALAEVSASTIQKFLVRSRATARGLPMEKHV
jgi:hypothetical protein